MQQIRCIKAFGNAQPGDAFEVPDGALTDPEYWEVVIAAPPSASAVRTAVPAAPVTPAPVKEGA